MTSHDRLGSELAGYRIESVIGRGGMSVVYLAEETHLERRVALKLLAPELAEDVKFRERFIRESRLAASLEHPNIITVYEAREVEGQLYIAMRYISGGDLKGLIGREGPLDADRTISILTQAASALDAAHAEGLIHRDVKPGNILLNPRTESRGTDGVYLSDFGLTKRATSDSGITATGQFVGTLDYAAPEQFQGKPLDGRSDVYSLGCVLYECLTGEVPYPQENQAALVYAHLMAAPPKLTAKRTDLPAPIDDVVAKALAKSPGDRYPTAGALIEAAGEALGVMAVPSTTPTRPVQVPPASSRRSPAMLVGTGVAILLAIGAVVTLVLVNRHGKAAGGPTGTPAAALVDYLARVDSLHGTVSKIRVGKDPTSVATGEGSAWVANGDGSVSRVDPASGKATITIPVGKAPSAIAVGPGMVWVTDPVTRAVVRIDPATNRVAARLVLDATPRSVAIDESNVWVGVDEGSNGIGVWRIDPATNKIAVTTSLPGTGAGPFLHDVQVAAGGGSVWAATSGQLWRIDAATDAITRDVDLRKEIGAIDVAGNIVWVATFGTPGTVFRLDAVMGEIQDSIPAGGGSVSVFGSGKAIKLAADDRNVWVTDGVSGNVSRIIIISAQVSLPIDVGKAPTGVAVGLGSVWVTVDGP